MKNLVFFGVLVLAVAACNLQKNTASASEEFIQHTENQRITFTSLALKLMHVVENDSITPVNDIEVLLKVNLENGQYSGKAGCNNYFGGVEKVNDDVLKFSPGGMTEMMCAQDIMKIEALYMNTLTQNEFSIYIEGNTVVFTSQFSNQRLIFTQQETN